MEHNHYCCVKAVSTTYFECVFVALLIQHAKRLLHIILLFVACLAVSYFSKLSHKLYNFGENITEHKMCVLIFSTTLSEALLTLRRNGEILIWMYILYVFMLSTRYSCESVMQFESSWHIFKKSSNIKFHKIHPVGVKLFHVDREMDRQTQWS
jgi:hypothetical protein